ncbi:MAG: hypothetical protein ABH854_00910 [Candidatus Diapherotrites archaeon]|nr:hypothetical protein [Candidatus Micrarchaeota archaeon]
MKTKLLFASLLIAGLLLFGCPQPAQDSVSKPIVEQASPDQCAQNGESGLGCYTALAIETGDPEVCNNLTNSILALACVMGMELQESDCGELEADLANYCYYSVATRDELPEICEKISDDLILNDECYRSLAITMGDKTLCENVVDKTTRAVCE